MNKIYLLIAISFILIFLFCFNTKTENMNGMHISKRYFNPVYLNSSWWTWGGSYLGSPNYKLRKSYDPMYVGTIEKPIYIKNSVFSNDVVKPFPRPISSNVC